MGFEILSNQILILNQPSFINCWVNWVLELNDLVKFISQYTQDWNSLPETYNLMLSALQLTSFLTEKKKSHQKIWVEEVSVIWELNDLYTRQEYAALERLQQKRY